MGVGSSSYKKWKIESPPPEKISMFESHQRNSLLSLNVLLINGVLKEEARRKKARVVCPPEPVCCTMGHFNFFAFLKKICQRAGFSFNAWLLSQVSFLKARLLAFKFKALRLEVKRETSLTFVPVGVDILISNGRNWYMGGIAVRIFVHVHELNDVDYS